MNKMLGVLGVWVNSFRLSSFLKQFQNDPHIVFHTSKLTPKISCKNPEFMRHANSCIISGVKTSDYLSWTEISNFLKYILLQFISPIEDKTAFIFIV